MDRSLFARLLESQQVGLFVKKINESQSEGLSNILDAFAIFGDSREKSLAYILATAFHEVGGRMTPVREGFAKSDNEAKKKVASRSYGKAGAYGNVFYGRGLVQLTHENNYKLFSDRLGVDLVRQPDLALDPQISARILVEGIIEGNFNGKRKGIEHYLPTNGQDDLENARRTVNVTDRWQLIGGYYKKFLECLVKAGGVPVADISSSGSLTAEDLITASDREESRSTDQLLANPNSKNLPKYRPKQKANTTLSILEKFQHLLPLGRENDPVFVVGIRGYYTNTMGIEGKNDRGIYDDAVFVVEPDNVHNFNANTDPSTSRENIAQLKSPQVILYKPGMHGISRGKGYPAFRQASVCTVVRDNYGEDTDTKDKRFWINLHRGGVNSTSSAGCQTLPPHQWLEFKSLVDTLLKKYKQESFCYLLIDASDVPVVSTPPISQTLPIDEVTLETNQDNISQSTMTPRQLENILIELITGYLTKKRNIQNSNFGKTTEITNTQAEKVLDEHSKAKLQSEEKNEPELTPMNAVFGETIGKLLNGRKTGIGILGLLATSLLPTLFPETGGAIVSAFDMGAGSEPASVEDGTTVLNSLFASILAWGAPAKLEKWVYKFLKTER